MSSVSRHATDRLTHAVGAGQIDRIVAVHINGAPHKRSVIALLAQCSPVPVIPARGLAARVEAIGHGIPVGITHRADASQPIGHGLDPLAGIRVATTIFNLEGPFAVRPEIECLRMHGGPTHTLAPSVTIAALHLR